MDRGCVHMAWLKFWTDGGQMKVGTEEANPVRVAVVVVGWIDGALPSVIRIPRVLKERFLIWRSERK